MAKKVFRFRGKTIEELQAMNINDFAELCDSRTKKTLKKGFDKHLLKKIEKAKENEKTVRTHKKDVVIIPLMIGTKFAVYKGNGFEQVNITEKMLGHYLGEFIFTRKRLQHGKAGIGATKSSTAVSTRG